MLTTMRRETAVGIEPPSAARAGAPGAAIVSVSAVRRIQVALQFVRLVLTSSSVVTEGERGATAQPAAKILI